MKKSFCILFPFSILLVFVIAASGLFLTCEDVSVLPGETEEPGELPPNELAISGLEGDLSSYAVYVFNMYTDLSTNTQIIGALGANEYIAMGAVIGKDADVFTLMGWNSAPQLPFWTETGNFQVVLVNANGSTSDPSKPMYRKAVISFTKGSARADISDFKDGNWTPPEPHYLYENNTLAAEPMTLDEAFAWIAINAEDNSTYRIVLVRDEMQDSRFFDDDSVNSKKGVTIILEGKGEERLIQNIDASEYLFYFDFTMKTSPFLLVLDRNITLKGGDVVVSPNPTFGLEMRTGSKITGAPYAGVYVNGGSFTMSGGDITGNGVSTIGSFKAGGVCVMYAIDGGVFVPGKFEMKGGNINYNKSTDMFFAAGGVFVGDGATFIKTGGVIAGNSARGAELPPGFLDDRAAHQVACLHSSNPFTYYRINEDINYDLDSSKPGAAGGWPE